MEQGVSTFHSLTRIDVHFTLFFFLLSFLLTSSLFSPLASSSWLSDSNHWCVCMYMTERLFLVSIHPFYPFSILDVFYHQKCLGRWILTLTSFSATSSTPWHFNISTYLMVGVNRGPLCCCWSSWQRWRDHRLGNSNTLEYIFGDYTYHSEFSSIFNYPVGTIT